MDIYSFSVVFGANCKPSVIGGLQSLVYLQLTGILYIKLPNIESLHYKNDVFGRWFKNFCESE